jgi:hypothetical protein
MRPILSLALFIALTPGLQSCTTSSDVLRAKVIADRSELIGGPVAMADVGDFLLENDQIRVAILGAKDSPGPGVFGGSIVDIDIRRSRLGFEGAQGHDRFAEAFPVANLLVPDPRSMQVSVLADGKDGKEAAIRVEGQGAYLFEALSVLKQNPVIPLSTLFPALKASLRFRTDYILRPGDRHLTLRTTLVAEQEPPAGCTADATCGKTCENGLAADAKGCPHCECAQPIPLDQYHEASSVFDGILGDYEGAADRKVQAGIVAGDFVFFGNQNDVFAPLIGYDEERAVNEAFYTGQNTFKKPLTFDFVAASGGDVSYGYFTAPRPGEPDTVVNVPLFTSAATAFLSAGKQCLFDTSDDETCDSKHAFTYERYLAVGDGDIASVAAEAWKMRGTRTGKLAGIVTASANGEPSPNAQVFVFKDLDPRSEPTSVDSVAEANRKVSGQVGLIDVIDADVGLDLLEDGDYHGDLPEGAYIVIARSADGMALSTPTRISVLAGQTTRWNASLTTPATLEYRVTSEGGNLSPAKIALISLDDKGVALERDGLRRVYLGDSRNGNGVRTLEHSTTGQGSLRVEPGRYRIRASRGPEYSIFELPDVTLAPGQVLRFDAPLRHEVDTTGWMSTDMHLHAEPSFDSGMAFARRLATVVDEQVELAIPTDHDVVTDYGPMLRALFLAPYVASIRSAETTTIEQGHFIAFPLRYDATILPTHGAYDPTCQGGGEILDGLRNQGEGMTPLTIVAHPRDGFFGYIDQLNVDPFTLNRSTTLLEGNNPVFRTASCDFDAMEVINGKRFDLVRTATVEEVVDYNRCRARIDAARDEAALDAACPEIAPGKLAACMPGERFDVCQHRNRAALAWALMKRILTRTPEEQEALWSFDSDATASQQLCANGTYEDRPIPAAVKKQPCAYRSGQLDDFFRYLEHGMVKTQVASSDSHGPTIEPGSPRTYFRSPTDAPSALPISAAVESLRGGHAVATYGPFVTADIDGKTFGEVVRATAGGKATLNLRVQTASWFGVDRIEIYENGHLVRVETPKSRPVDIEDYKGPVTIDVPAGRDSWVVVVAMGLEDGNVMSPASLDISFGEIQLSKITADAFALVPVINTVFKPSPLLPDFHPIPAYAVTNPIFLDTGGDGRYDAPLPAPDFCSRPCASSEDCPEGQQCLTDAKVCGFNIAPTCDHRLPWLPAGH